MYETMSDARRIVDKYKSVIKSLRQENNILRKEIEETKNSTDLANRQISFRKRPYSSELSIIDGKDKEIQSIKEKINLAKKNISDIEETLKEKNINSREEFKLCYDECNQLNSQTILINEDIKIVKSETQDKIYQFRRDNKVSELENEVSELKRKIRNIEFEIQNNNEKYKHVRDQIDSICHN